MKTTTNNGTFALIITTTAFSAFGRRKHEVLVDEDGTVRVYDSTAGCFTRCHSISPQVQGVIRARWAKAWKARVGHAAGHGFGVDRKGLSDQAKSRLSEISLHAERFQSDELAAHVLGFFEDIGQVPTPEAAYLIAERN